MSAPLPVVYRNFYHHAVAPSLQVYSLLQAHDFQVKTWRHLNFFQHHCYIHASVPRVKWSEHGVKLIDVRWAGKGKPVSPFTAQSGIGKWGLESPQKVA